MIETDTDNHSDKFNYTKFHEEFSELINNSKRDTSVNLRSYIEDNAGLWFDYDPLSIDDVSSVLENEVYRKYGLVIDLNGNVIIKKHKKGPYVKKNECSMRSLVMEFLEKEGIPKTIPQIVNYVNSKREKEAQSHVIRNLLQGDKKVFISFVDGYYGLRCIPYDNTLYKEKESKKKVTYHDNNLDLYETYSASENLSGNETEKIDLHSQDFKIRYVSKSENSPIDFFNKALSNSTKFDIGLGYFSSACFNILACGFAHFVKNKGKMRMYINPDITEDDYKLLKNGDSTGFNEVLTKSYDKLLSVFSKRDELFFKCLSYLITNERIEIKIVVLKENGIAHEKFGIFTDPSGNRVAFNGSMNLTASGLTRNIEAVDCVCSWAGNDSEKRINCYQNDFDRIWYGNNKDILIYSGDEFCKKIVTKYPSDNVSKLMVLENEALNAFNSSIKTTIDEKPHFPIQYSEGPRQYQKDAYQAWVNNGRNGIFAMATGTGKTITSLNCALEEYGIDDYYRLLILVPSITLVEQWCEEVANFNFCNVIKVYAENSSWKKEFVSIITKINRGKNENFVIIATYQSFITNDFQILFTNIPKGTILIADEAHNIGSSVVRQAFRKMTIDRRIALSATPNRVYDEEGSKDIETFFNDTFPYTYSYSMRKAIEDERLMPYQYFPYMAKLDDSEMEEYAKITKQLVKMYDCSIEGFTNPEKAKKLLLIRKNILHKAKDKLNVFRNIIKEIGEDKLKYCFVYSAAGKRAHYDTQDNDEDDTYIMDEMQSVLKQTFPNKTCNSYTSEDNKETRKDKLNAFANGQLDVLFAKNCLDEGVDVPRAEFGIFTSSTGNPRQFIQRRGRLLRKHKEKTFAWIYDMIVVPNFNSKYYDRKFWKLEKNLVENEMRRVANFGSLASNYYSGALRTLDELINFYEIDLNGMVLEEEKNNL